MKYLVDSNIFIYALNDIDESKVFIKRNYNEISISFISLIEVLSNNYSEEEYNQVKEYLNYFHCYYVTDRIIDKAIKNTYIRKIQLPDNIIAATAQINKLKLVTANEKDFKGLDIEIVNPLSPSPLINKG